LTINKSCCCIFLGAVRSSPNFISGYNYTFLFYFRKEWCINVSVTETNEDTITFELYYSNGTLINSSAFTDGTRTINFTSLADNTYVYNVTINDSAENSNSTLTRSIGLDNVAPNVTLIVYYPNSTDDVDPNENITFNSTVTDATTSVDTAILQYYNETGWTNSTMSRYNSTSNVYNTTLTLLSSELNYTFNIWANDSANNINISTNQTFSSAYDCTWQVNPDLGATSGFGVSKGIGNITINNTGDAAYTSSNCSLDFRLTYDLTEGRIFFDDDSVKPTDPYTIAAKGQQNITINASFLSEIKEESVIISTDEIRGREILEGELVISWNK